jgi:hypothetical protein
LWLAREDLRKSITGVARGRAERLLVLALRPLEDGAGDLIEVVCSERRETTPPVRVGVLVGVVEVVDVAWGILEANGKINFIKKK